MRKSVIGAIVVTLCAAASVFGQAAAPPQQTPPAAGQAPSPEAVQQQRQQLQQQLQQLQQQIQVLGTGTPSQELLQQVQQVSGPLALLSGGRSGRGGGGGGGQARAAGPAAYKCEPANPNATPEARALLKTLCDVSGKGILTGQHNFPNQRNLDTNRIFDATGKYPAIWGSDFGFTDGEDKDSIVHRDLMIAEAKKQSAAGSIIYFCWHMMRPTEDEPGKANPNGGSSDAWRGSVQAKLTDEQWTELITPDSPLHKRWEKYMDTAAGYLKQLQDAHIAVMWRPMHENNGTFFWWGGRPGPRGTAELYRQVYDRMVNVHHLNNLVWVWNQNGPAPGGEFYNYYPGKNYCDVVSYDNYRTLDDRYYYEIQTIADGKPIGFGEVGSIPSPETLKAQPKMAFYMTWASGGAQQAAPTATVQVQRQQLQQELKQLQQPLQQLGTGTPSAEFQQQVQQVSRSLAQLRTDAAKDALRTTYSNPYLLKRGDPIPK